MALPAVPGRFLGREEELSELKALLEREPLVTLTGAPGTGKTRLALELAAGLGGGYAAGAHVVELASVTRPAHVSRAVASALSIDEQPGQALVETIVARLARRRLLLVLDNCEHVLGGCAKLVGALLAGCPRLSILTTSREALGVSGERVWELAALAVPEGAEDAPEALAGNPAVGLFVERARAVQPDFSLNAYVSPAVVEIVRRLDGTPLAIELAAGRVASLTVAEIAGALSDRFALLSKGTDSEPARHQTLAAALDWSYELLTGPERALLRRLSVFACAFELEAVEAVCPGGEIEAGQGAELLAGLAGKSLVLVQAQSRPARYRLLETIRAYAAERLEQAGERAKLRSAHARFYLALAEQAEPELTGPEQEDWLGRLEAERANLRSAIEWSLSQGETEQALRLAGALVLYWRVRCHFSEGRELLEAAVAVSDGAPMALRAKALWGAGFMAHMVGHNDAAVASLEQSLALFHELEDRQGCARTLLVLGNCRQGHADQEATNLLAESAELARAAADPWCLGHALALAGFGHVSRNELRAARPLFEECLAVARDAEDEQSLRFGLLGLGKVAVGQGDYRSAELLLGEALTVARRLGEDYVEASTLQDLGELALYRGDYGRARELLDGARASLPEVIGSEAVRGLLLLFARLAHAQRDLHGAHVLFDEARALLGTGEASIVACQWRGELAADVGDMTLARRWFDDALELARGVGDDRFTARALHGLAQLARDAGDFGRSAVLHEEALELQRRIEDAPGIATSLEAVVGLAASAARHHLAAQLLGAAHQLRGRGGYARGPWEAPRYEADMTLAREGLRAEEFKAAWAQGAGLSIDDAATLASKGPGRPIEGWSSLSETQQEVAALVAEGLTNQEIAQRLLMSLGTVKTHLSRSFSRLGITRRSELAGVVWRHRMITEPTRARAPK